MRRRITSMLVFGVAFLVLCAPASASFHLIKIHEVFPGTAAEPKQNFVVLRMFAAGQNHLKTHSLQIKNGAGSTTGTLTFPSDVANGESGRNVLIATQETVDAYSNTAPADLLMPSTTDLIDPAGGQVCWAGVDCVSWGNFSASDPASGTPAAAIPDTFGLVRKLDRAGCAVSLDPADDTDDSAADLSAVQTTYPFNNAFAVSACANTTVTKKPKKKTTDRTPTIKFKASPSGAATACKIDSGNYKSCQSPFTTKKLKLGKHTVRIKASSTPQNADPTPAKVSFKVVKKHRHR